MADADEPVDDQSPVHQTLEIHRHRIATIIERMLQKISLAFCLPDLLLNDGKLIAPYLSEKDLETVMELNTKVHRSASAGFSVKSVGLSRSKTSRMRKSISQEFKHQHQDSNCSNMLAILHHSADVMHLVQEIIATKSPLDLQFLTRMEELRDHIIKMLWTSAAEERAYSKQIGRAWTNNENYKKKNEEMEKIHSNKIYELSFKINEKNTIIEKYKSQMKQTREKCVDDLHKIITKSERFMTKKTTASEESLLYLGDEAKHVTSQYQSLLEGHLAHEKALRVKRYKVETVLAGWLAKYDQEIGELQAQLEEQQDGYNKEKGDFDDLTERFNEQTLEYDILMEEKEIEEQRLFDIKRFEFMCLRSARRIQRWWRAILARRRGRRRGKGKGKGKKK